MRRGQNILEGLLPSSKLDVEEWIPDNPLEEENQRSREVGQTRSTATSILSPRSGHEPTDSGHRETDIDDPFGKWNGHCSTGPMSS